MQQDSNDKCEQEISTQIHVFTWTPISHQASCIGYVTRDQIQYAQTHSYKPVSGFVVTDAVKPTPEDPLPLVPTAMSATFMTALRS